jgi:hypothetical protein
LMTLAGRSITSPAAIFVMTFDGSWRIFGMDVRVRVKPRKTRKIRKKKNAT